MSEKITNALSKLDSGNDNHWTSEGFPRLDTVRLLAGDGAITRDLINATVPGFNRANTKAVQAPAQQPAPVGTLVVESAPAAGTQALAVACAAIRDKVNENLGSEVVVAEAPANQSLLDQALAKLGEAKAELDELRAVRDEVARRFAAKNLEVDRLLVKADSLRPANGPSNAVQGYLAQQRRNLAERGRRIAATKGINLKDFLPTKAPIDSRKRK